MEEEYKGMDVRYWEIPSIKKLCETLSHEQYGMFNEARWDYFQALMDKWHDKDSANAEKANIEDCSCKSRYGYTCETCSKEETNNE